MRIRAPRSAARMRRVASSPSSSGIPTPAVNATGELLPHLRNGHQVVLAELGHSGSFWSYEPRASTRLLNAFFDTGKVDTSLYTPAKVDFTPEVTQTALGTGFAATMIGLALLTVLSLCLMWWRVRRRGRFPIVLGLGGWFLGVLIVLTTMRDAALDDQVLASLSVGLPIGLDVYLAWVHRDWSSGNGATGLAAAVGGALLGGWLGFHAAGGLLALATTIVAATAGANLTLIWLDIVWDRQGRTRLARAIAAEPREARPSTG